MAYTGRTWTTGETVSAAMMNTIRDDLEWLKAEDYGEQTVYINAASLVYEAGAEPGAIEKLDNGTICHYGIPFDKDSDEYINFGLVMPKRYDDGSLYLAVEWTETSATTGSVVWQAEGNLLDDGDALCSDPASGGGNVTDARDASYDYLLTDWFEVTPEGSVSDENVKLEMRLGRDADNGSDDLDADAYLLGVVVRWTSNASTDD